jgi:bile acid:Na+ symporter, BASS family
MQGVLHLVAVLVTLSLAGLNFGIGLASSPRDIAPVLRQPGRLLKAVVAVNLVTPLAGAALIALFPVSPASQAAIMLMAVSPVPPFVPEKAMKVGAHRAYALALYVTLVVLAVVIVPVTVSILARLYGRAVSISPTAMAGRLGLGVLLPLAIGMALHAKFPGLAERAAPVLTRIATGLVVIAVLPIVVMLLPKLAALTGDGTVAAAILMVVAALVAGHLLGGPDPQDRATLAITAAMRHPGIAMMIVTANAAGKLVSLTIVLVLLAGLIAVAPYPMWLKRQASAGRGGGDR